MAHFKAFKGNEYPTVGVEEEFHLIDPESAELVPKAEKVRKRIVGELRRRVAYELKYCVFEMQSLVFSEISGLEQAILAGRRQLAEAAAKAGVGIAAAATHPFSDWSCQPYVRKPHYLWVKQETGYLSDRMLCFGLHIHVGMRNAEAALYAIHEFRKWIYPMLALSANSPFFEGRDTGLASTRHHLFSSLPRTGLPPDVLDIDYLADLFDRHRRAGDATKPNDLWWNMRPQPLLGTAELRICDMPTEPGRVGVLAAVVQAAFALFQERFLAGAPPTILKEEYIEQNRWQAMRHGLDGSMINAETGRVVPTRRLLERLLTIIASTARQLGSTDYLEKARAILDENNEAAAQRRLLSDLGGDMRALELDIARRTLG